MAETAAPIGSAVGHDPLNMRASPLKLRDPDAEYRAGWVELLFDLAFVVALGSTTHTLVGMQMPDGLMQFLISFLLLTWSWTTFTFFVSAFEGAEDWHFVALIQMALVLVLVSFHDLYKEDFREFVIGYTALRLVGGGMYIVAWRDVPQVARFAKIQVWGFLLALVPLWLGWFTDDPHQREVFLFATALLQVLVGVFAFLRDSNLALNGSHVPERLGLFITLSLGECFLSVAHVGEHVNAVSLLAIIHGLLAVWIVFALWRIYFGMLAVVRFDGRNARAVFWMVFHLPLVTCILGLATGLERDLEFIRQHEPIASNRLLIGWGGAVLSVVVLGMFWRPAIVGLSRLRRVVSQWVAASAAIAAITLPLAGQVVSPGAALYGLAVASLVVMVLNPSIRPWGAGALPTPQSFEQPG